MSFRSIFVCVFLSAFIFINPAFASGGSSGPHCVPSGDINPDVWDPLDNQWENGLPRGYAETQTTVMTARIDSGVTGQRKIDLCLQVPEWQFGDFYYGFNEFSPWNTTYTPPSFPDNSPINISDSLGGIEADNIDLISVSAPSMGNGACSSGYLGVHVVFSLINTSQRGYLLWGGRFAAGGDTLPAGTFDSVVPANHGASFILGTFQSRLACPGVGDKTINFKGQYTSLVPGINLTKTVAPENGICGIDDVDMLSVAQNDNVKFCFVITNTGQGDLLNVTLNDPILGIDLTPLLNGRTDEDNDMVDDDLAPGQFATAEYIHQATTTMVNTAHAYGLGVSAQDPSTTVVYFCGDGNVDMGEECDDGNTNDDDGCSSTCQVEVCGDGITQSNEQCDDGNTNSDDGCSSTCFVEFCGDGIQQINENCDDGNMNSGDGCSSACEVEVCGDSVVQAGLGEQCDDGNTNDFDGCSSTCQNEVCGDGILQPNEACDDGNTTSEDGCSSSCTVEICGDGVTQAGLGEACDDGNTTSGDGCSNSCQTEFCGDGIAQAGLGEQCDDGNNINNDGCSSSCLTEVCGDGVTQTNEQCDDGNINNNDGCSSSCQTESCGDGIQQTSEQCDDGNQTSGDGCSNSCVNEFCGDGITQQGLGEQCDDANNVSNDGCSESCQVESCGDGVQQSNEQCDDGNDISGDGCSNDCVTEVCGDQIVQIGLGEQCDDGNTVDNDGCSSICQLESCGDGIVQASEGCDDGNNLDGDGCSADCQIEIEATCALSLVDEQTCENGFNVISVNSEVNPDTTQYVYEWSQDCGDATSTLSTTGGLEIETLSSETSVVSKVTNSSNQEVQCTVSLIVRNDAGQEATCSRDYSAYNCELSCTSTDAAPIQTQMDGLGQAQHAVNGHIGKILKKNGAKKFAKGLLAQSSELATDNWELTWSLPSEHLTCANQFLCSSVDNTDTVSTYNQNASELQTIAKKLYNKVRKNKALGSDQRGFARKLFKEAKKLYKQTQDASSQIDPVSSTCTNNPTIIVPVN